MDNSDEPEPDYDFVERLLIRAGLVGFIAGLIVINSVIYVVWRAVSRFFFGA